MAIAAAIFAFPAVARAAAPALRFSLPIACTPNQTCWIMNYPDDDPGPGRADYRCGWLSYNGHRGTDFMIRDFAAMDAGVAVRAAAAGQVFWKRDGMPDTGTRDAHARQVIRGRDCGNGVAIRHRDGWVTRYCHMRRDSVRVALGEQVQRGQTLGFVGMSGLAPLPHLHFSVRHDGRVVDPFVGLTPGPKCQAGPHPLWDAKAEAALAYSSVDLFNAGFAAKPPTVSGLKKGLYHDPVLSARAPALLMWVEVLWPRPGDDLEIRIVGPDGHKVVDYRHTYDGKRTPYRMFFAGERRKPIRWPAGTYTGEITLRRAHAPEGPFVKRVARRVEIR